MEMYVFYRLPCRLPVVLKYVEPGAFRGRLHFRGDAFYASDEFRQYFLIRIKQPFAVGFGNDQSMTPGERIDIEIRQKSVIFIDLERRDLPFGYSTEYAVVVE